MLDLIREAPIGQAIRLISRNRLLQYPEENAGFQLPPQYAAQLKQSEQATEKDQSPDSNGVLPNSTESSDAGSSGYFQGDGDDVENLGTIRTVNSIRTAPYSNEQMRAEQQLNLQQTKSLPINPQKTSDGIILVDWYTTDDPANPQNWSPSKKYFIVFVLCFYTWTVYCAGPIYAAAEGGIQEHFGVSPVASTLGLSLYVLAYGLGDLLFSPLTEIPVVGRNSVYYLTFIVFWILSFPEAIIDSFGGLLALRFWLGFFGSPALANGGATVGDMFSLVNIPYGLSWWVFSAWAGPAFGPLLGGFAAQAKGWRWPLWEIVWMASPALIFLLTLMPETSTSNILLRRARRLRQLTGDSRLQSQSEIEQRHMKASDILSSALVKPMEIMFKDPSILFVHLYTGYFYGVFYTFFEVFPIVFPGFYGFDLAQTGLTFLSCLIGVIIALGCYFAYLYFYMVPDNIKNGFREQEHRLVPAIVDPRIADTRASSISEAVATISSEASPTTSTEAVATISSETSPTTSSEVLPTTSTEAVATISYGSFVSSASEGITTTSSEAATSTFSLSNAAIYSDETKSSETITTTSSVTVISSSTTGSSSPVVPSAPAIAYFNVLAGVSASGGPAPDTILKTYPNPKDGKPLQFNSVFAPSTAIFSIEASTGRLLLENGKYVCVNYDTDHTPGSLTLCTTEDIAVNSYVTCEQPIPGESLACTATAGNCPTISTCERIGDTNHQFYTLYLSGGLGYYLRMGRPTSYGYFDKYVPIDLKAQFV
ncbi:hypothetical protein G7Z17_g2207 [Cylindrodendrum hubeiense]|uniref:Major facilitator superfamily (MFS) profile domain-containing protein n=1 Tax=Cylindrodendrum hubeiense TaxID=595255 RepID=A0A9P5HI34_9HYPO|nr:hypothetical protein G7Z17_g2207 [Cylindrodendrum hubeiense]